MSRRCKSCDRSISKPHSADCTHATKQGQRRNSEPHDFGPAGNRKLIEVYEVVRPAAQKAS